MYMITIARVKDTVRFYGDEATCMAIAHAVERAQLDYTGNDILSITVEDTLDLDAKPSFEVYC